MKNVVYIVNQLRKSGPVNVLLDIITALDRRRYTPIIIKFMQDDIERSMTYKFIDLDVKVIELNLSFWNLELQTRRVALMVDHILDELEADIVHTHGYHPVLVTSYLKKNIVKLETLHCVCGEDFCYSKGWLVGKYMTWRYLNRLQYFDYAVAISKTVQHYYKERVPHVKVRLNYNGTQFKYINGINKEELRKRLNLPLDKKIFVVIGTLSERKDPKIIIEVFNKLKHADQGVLIFLGRGSLLEECQSMAQTENIIFQGYVLNVEEYLRAADYSICASRSEGFGLNFIESIVCGCPVIGSNIGPFNEFREGYPILQNLSFEVGNVQQLSAQIQKALSVTIDITDVAKVFSEMYSAKRMSRAYMQIYD